MSDTITINGFSVLVLRILLSGIFIIAGISHLVNPEKVTQRINQANYSEFAQFFGDVHFLGIASGYVLLIFGTAFLLGIFTKWSALVLFAVLVPITVSIQMGNGLMHGPLWKNIALFGGLLFFMINNPKQYNIYNP